MVTHCYSLHLDCLPKGPWVKELFFIWILLGGDESFQRHSLVGSLLVLKGSETPICSPFVLLTSQLWSKQLCSSANSHHGALTHHRPQVNMNNWLWTEGISTISQSKPSVFLISWLSQVCYKNRSRWVQSWQRAVPDTKGLPSLLTPIPAFSHLRCHSHGLPWTPLTFHVHFPIGF